jgi:hypothetical protein
LGKVEWFVGDLTHADASLSRLRRDILHRASDHLVSALPYL